MAFVYIFQSGTDNFFKIGMTRKDPEERRKELSTGNPHPLTLFDLIETDENKDANVVERYLHKKFAQYRVHGGTATEYFEIDPETLASGLAEAKVFLREYLEVKKVSEGFKEIDETTGEELEADDEAQVLRQQMKDVRSQIDQLKVEDNFLTFKLQQKIGQSDGISGIATWKVQAKKKFDEKSFKEKYPDIYQEFLGQTISRAFRLK